MCVVLSLEVHHALLGMFYAVLSFIGPRYAKTQTLATALVCALPAADVDHPLLGMFVAKLSVPM